MEKPTGNAELPDYVELARQIEEAITMKSGTIAIDDSEWDDADVGSENDIEGKVVLEVSSESDEGAKVMNAGSKKTVTKAFRANPLLDPGHRRPRTTAASEALSSLTSVFNPAIMKERDETRLSSLVQFNQISTLQAELREARQRNESLNDRLLQECRRADRAESQVEMLKYMLSSRNDAYTPARSHHSPRKPHVSPYYFNSPSQTHRQPSSSSHRSPVSPYHVDSPSRNHSHRSSSSTRCYSPPALEYSSTPQAGPSRSNGLDALALAADIKDNHGSE